MRHRGSGTWSRLVSVEADEAAFFMQLLGANEGVGREMEPEAKLWRATSVRYAGISNWKRGLCRNDSRTHLIYTETHDLRVVRAKEEAMINTIRLERYEVKGWVEPAVRIMIDGQDLIDLIRAVELPLAEQEGHPNIAGGYEGLSLSEVAPPSRRFWGTSEENEGGDKVAVLTCADCGEEMCWPFLVRIEVGENYVRWSEFEQPYRKSWSYEELGQFVFDKNKYEQQIASLKKRKE